MAQAIKHRSKNRKLRQRKKGIQRNEQLCVAMKDAIKELEEQKRLNNALEREKTMLRAKVERLISNSCTKASVVHLSTKLSELPPTIRRIEWDEIKSTTSRTYIGKGAFAKCYTAQMGSMKVCIKVLYAGCKYKSLFYNEANILSKLCHFNLPWLHGFCSDGKHIAIIMTSHQWQHSSLHICAGLRKSMDGEELLSHNNWKEVLTGCVSALAYLQTKNILHNDIKSDNIVIEKMETAVRSVLIDFNKACNASDAQIYKLSEEEKTQYEKKHPQIAPEVRNGSHPQSFASDVYSMGRVIQKIDASMLKIPLVGSLAKLCLSCEFLKRPTACELATTFKNILQC